MLKLLGKFFTNRIAIFTMLTIGVIIVLTLVAAYLNSLSHYFYFAFALTSIIAAFEILSRNTYPEYKIAWILVVAGLPLFGFVFYLILGRKNISNNAKQKYDSTIKNAHLFLQSSQKPKMDKTTKICEKIIYSHCKMPAFCAKSIKYYSSGKLYYLELLRQLEKSSKYIFLEYFSIKSGEVWNSILQILKQKARSGVKVRIIYDDFGSVLSLPRNYPKQLKKYGISAMRFNRIVPLFDARMNIRNHRKTVVIDGNVAFVSGANIGDEYAEITSPYGKWKDFAVKITGEAANSFAVSFLDSWTKRKKEENIEKYLIKNKSKTNISVIPFQDSPLYKSSVFEEVLLNLIYSAKHNIKITTPYLVPTSEIMSALTSAVRRGVDVSICLPGTPDKRSIYQMTKTFAIELAQKGIKIYCYSPGFLHSKLFTADNTYSIVGSSNLDLRSIHSNYEINMFVFDRDFVRNVNNDIENIISKSHIFESSRKQNIFVRSYRAIIRLFAPLM